MPDIIGPLSWPGMPPMRPLLKYGACCIFDGGPVVVPNTCWGSAPLGGIPGIPIGMGAVELLPEGPGARMLGVGSALTI